MKHVMLFESFVSTMLVERKGEEWLELFDKEKGKHQDKMVPGTHVLVKIHPHDKFVVERVISKVHKNKNTASFVWHEDDHTAEDTLKEQPLDDIAIDTFYYEDKENPKAEEPEDFDIPRKDHVLMGKPVGSDAERRQAA